MMRLSLSGRSLRSLNFLLLFAPDHGPALKLGNRSPLLDPHQVAHRIRVGLVVCVVLLRTADRLAHRRVRKTPLNAHDHGFVLLVAHDNALERTLRHLEPLIPSTSSWRATSASRQPSVLRSWSFFRPSARQLSRPA